MSGNVKNGFKAEFAPTEVGIHTILVEYNGVAVGNTPFYAKAFDPNQVGVSDVPKSNPGKTVTFAGMGIKIRLEILGTFWIKMRPQFLCISYHWRYKSVQGF